MRMKIGILMCFVTVLGCASEDGAQMVVTAGTGGGPAARGGSGGSGGEMLSGAAGSGGAGALPASETGGAGGSLAVGTGGTGGQEVGAGGAGGSGGALMVDAGTGGAAGAGTGGVMADARVADAGGTGGTGGATDAGTKETAGQPIATRCTSATQCASNLCCYTVFPAIGAGVCTSIDRSVSRFCADQGYPARILKNCGYQQLQPGDCAP